MAEEQVLEQEQKTEEQKPDLSSILQKAAFDENPIEEKKVVEEKKEEKIEEDEIIEPKDWLKREFDIEDAAILKAEREELKTVKEKLKKFEIDDNGFKVLDYLKNDKEDDLYNYLNTKKKIEKLTSNEVSDSNAADIVKFQMQQKYSTLSEEDISYKFERQFGTPKPPKEPQEDKFNTTEEYETAKEQYLEDKQEWEQKVSSIKKELLIEAKLAVPEIQKLKTELILPDIEREIKGQKELSPEELAAFNKDKESFLQTVQNVNKDFTGFTANVKNKDVDYNVAYTPSQEEKNMISQRMQTFAESGFDANSLFIDRWVNKDMSLNVQQMIEDWSRIFMGKNSDLKIANEAANKRLELYLQDKKQIDIKQTNEEGKLSLQKGDEKIEDKLRERMLTL